MHRSMFLLSRNQRVLLRCSLSSGRKARALFSKWETALDLDQITQGELRLANFLVNGPAGLTTLRLGSLFAFTRLRNQTLRQKSISIIQALSANGIKAVPIKGAADLLRDNVPIHASKFTSDIDIVVSPVEVSRACSTLSSLGFRPSSDTWLDQQALEGLSSQPKKMKYVLGSRHSIDMVNDSGLQVDLHWKISKAGANKFEATEIPIGVGHVCRGHLGVSTSSLALSTAINMSSFGHGGVLGVLSSYLEARALGVTELDICEAISSNRLDEDSSEALKLLSSLGVFSGQSLKLDAGQKYIRRLGSAQELDEDTRFDISHHSFIHVPMDISTNLNAGWYEPNLDRVWSNYPQAAISLRSTSGENKKVKIVIRYRTMARITRFRFSEFFDSVSIKGDGFIMPGFRKLRVRKVTMYTTLPAGQERKFVVSKSIGIRPVAAGVSYDDRILYVALTGVEVFVRA